MNTLSYIHREYCNNDKGSLEFLVVRTSDCAARLKLSIRELGVGLGYGGTSIDVALTKVDFEELHLVLTELLKDWA